MRGYASRSDNLFDLKMRRSDTTIVRAAREPDHPELDDFRTGWGLDASLNFDANGLFVTIRLSLPANTGDGTQFLPLESYEVQLSSGADESVSSAFTRYYTSEGLWPADPSGNSLTLAPRIQSYATENLTLELISDQPNEQSHHMVSTRARVCNVLGCSMFTSPSTRMIIRRPSAPRSLSAEATGVLELSISFSGPLDSGGGYGFECIKDKGGPCISSYHYSLRHSSAANYNEPLEPTSSFVAIPVSDVDDDGEADTLDAFAISGLTRGEYKVAVRAVNEAAIGVGPWSEEFAAIAVGAASAPTHVTVRPHGIGALHVEWQPPQDCGSGLPPEQGYSYCTGYELLVNDLNSSFAAVHEVALQLPVASFTASNLIIGHLIAVRVRALNQFVGGEYSPAVLVYSLSVPSVCKVDRVLFEHEDANGTVSLRVQWTTPDNTGKLANVWVRGRPSSAKPLCC